MHIIYFLFFCISTNFLLHVNLKMKLKTLYIPFEHIVVGVTEMMSVHMQESQIRGTS